MLIAMEGPTPKLDDTECCCYLLGLHTILQEVQEVEF